MATTLRDIAERLDISPTLVSRVLNNKPGGWASEATRARIFETAHALNYRPSASARALVTGKSMLLAVSAADSDWYHTKTGRVAEMRGVIDAAAVHQYRVLVLPSGDSHASVSEFEALVRSNGCDGFCLYAEQAGPDLYAFLREHRTPFVVIGHPEADDVPRVDHNNQARIWESMHWLVAQKRQRIALIAPHQDMNGTPLRPFSQTIQRTFEESTTQLCGEFDPALMPARDWNTKEIGAWVKKARPDALILRGLSSTMQWKFALTAAKIAIPEDIVVMAHIDLAELAYLQQADLHQGLACNVHDPHAVGQTAGDVLIRWINGQAPASEPILVPSSAPRWC